MAEIIFAIVTCVDCDQLAHPSSLLRICTVSFSISKFSFAACMNYKWYSPKLKLSQIILYCNNSNHSQILMQVHVNKVNLGKNRKDKQLYSKRCRYQCHIFFN